MFLFKFHLKRICHQTPKNEFFRTSRMAWKVMALAAKPDNMSSISRTHVAEGENQLPQDIF